MRPASTLTGIVGDDEGCVPTIPVKVDAGRIYLLREAVVSKPARRAKAA